MTTRLIPLAGAVLLAWGLQPATAEAQMAPNPFGQTPLMPNLLLPNPLNPTQRPNTGIAILPNGQILTAPGQVYLDRRCLADCTEGGAVSRPPLPGKIGSTIGQPGNGSYRNCSASCRYLEQNPATPLLSLDPTNPVFGSVDYQCAKSCEAKGYTYSLCQMRCAATSAE